MGLLDRFIDKLMPAEVAAEERVKVPEVKRLLAQMRVSLERSGAEFAGQKEIIYSGFENDPDFVNIKKSVEKAFGKDRLKECLISKIVHFPDCSFIVQDGDNYYWPQSEYARKLKETPSLKIHNRRAENFCINNFKEERKRRSPVPMPIAIYSFFSKDVQANKYLQDVPTENRMKVYKVGLVMHEVAHSVYYFLLDEQAKKDWTRLIRRRSAGLTEYSDTYYSEEAEADAKLREMEEFAEAVRLFTTRNDYLKTSSPDIHAFISKLNISQLDKEDL